MPFDESDLKICKNIGMLIRQVASLANVFLQVKELSFVTTAFFTASATFYVFPFAMTKAPSVYAAEFWVTKPNTNTSNARFCVLPTETTILKQRKYTSTIQGP
jgi:hypothetical protein